MVVADGAEARTKQCTLLIRKQTSDHELPQPPKRITSLNWRKKFSAPITAPMQMLASPPLTVHRLENSPSLFTRIPIDNNRNQRRVESNRADISGRQKVVSLRKLKFQTMLRKGTDTNEIRMATTRLALIGNMRSPVPDDFVTPNTPSSAALSLKQLPKGDNGSLFQYCRFYTLARSVSE